MVLVLLRSLGLTASELAQKTHWSLGSTGLASWCVGVITTVLKLIYGLVWFEVKIDKVWLFLGRTFRGRISAREISLTNLQLQDSAVYQCEASNKHGTILASANVNVLSE